MLILNPWGISFHAAAVVFGLGKDLLFKFVLGHCEKLWQYIFFALRFAETIRILLVTDPCYIFFSGNFQAWSN